MKKSNAYVTVSELATFKTELLTEVKTAIADAFKGQMKASTPKSGRGNASVSVTVPAKKTIKDFEPKKDADGNYNWRSYECTRTRYCYYVATNGELEKNPYGTKWQGKIDYTENGAYKKAKAQFEKKYKYVRLSDR